MIVKFGRAVAFAMAACIGIAGCSSSNSPAPTPTATPAPTNISGDYTGTLNDAQNGNGTASAVLAQTGSYAGGAVTAVGTKTLTYQTALTLNSNNGVTGNMVVDFPNTGPQCSFSVTGTFNASTNVLSGNYTAVSGCSGDTGTFSLTQNCVATPSAGPRQRMTTPNHC